MCEAERNVCGREMKIRHEIERSACVRVCGGGYMVERRVKKSRVG